MNAGTLEIQLAADVARLRADMNNALGIVQRTARGFDDAATQMRNALGGIGGGLSAAAFGTWIKSAIDFQDQLNDLNKTTDIAVSKLAGISLMSKQTGSDLTGMAQAMNKLTLEMGKAPEKFAKIGITAKSPLEAFKQLSDIFTSIEDPQLRAAVAAEALGKGWASAAPALAEGSKAIGDMVRRGEELAGITKLDAEMADAFNDSMSELQLALMGTASNLAGDMLPLLTELVKSLTEVTAEANNTETPFNVLTETLRALIVIGGNVAFVIHGIAVEIGGMAAQAAAFVSGNFSQAAQIGRDMTADAEKRRAAFDAWEQRMMSAGKTARGEAEETKRSAQSLSDAVLKSFVDGGAGAKAANKELEDQARLLAELAGLSGSFAADWARLNTIYAKGAITLEQLTAAQANLLAQQPAFKKEQKEQEDAAKKLIEKWAEEKKVIDELIDSRERQFVADAKVIKSAEDMLAQAQFELSLLGLSNVERDKAVALRQLEATGIDKATLKYAELAEAMSKAVGDRAAMQKQIDDFQSIWGSIDRTAQQTFTNIFEGGQDAFTKLRDTLKATLLDLLYQMTVRKWVFNLAANVTGASSTAAGAVGQATGINSLSSLGGLGNLAGGGMSMANSLGTSFANITGGGLDTLLATNGAFGTAGGAAGGLMSGIGAAAPWVAGALAIASLLDKPGGGPKTIGGASDAATIQATVQATLAQFGIRNAGLRVGGFSAADPQGDSLTQLQTALFQGDRALYSRQDRVGNYENVGRSSEELAAAWAEEQSRIMLAALQATLEPKYQQYLAGISADASSLDEVNAALARLTTARTLEERLLELSSTEAENLARARARELDAMDAALRPLAQQVWALEDAAKNATKNATSGLASMRSEVQAYATGLEDNALAALQRALDAERTLQQAARDAASESVSTLRGLFDTLGSAARDLYGQTAATRNAAGGQGSAFIAQALATARASGYLPQGDQLSQAIGAARAGIDGGQFRTVRDREFAQLVLAGQLSELQQISGDQLTEAERALQTAEDQLRMLERTYDTARAQLDAVRGVDASIMTLAQALAAFQGALQTAGNVRGAAGAGMLSQQAIADWALPRLGVSEAANRALYNDALANRDRGVTLDKIDAAAGFAPGTSAAWAIANGLTPFAVGTNYVPTDMPAFLHEGEAVVPKAYNPAAGGVAGGAGAADVLDRLDRRFEQMDKRLAAIERSTLRTADAANGRPEQPMPVEVIA